MVWEPRERILKGEAARREGTGTDTRLSGGEIRDSGRSPGTTCNAWRSAGSGLCIKHERVTGCASNRNYLPWLAGLARITT